MSESVVRVVPWKEGGLPISVLPISVTLLVNPFFAILSYEPVHIPVAILLLFLIVTPIVFSFQCPVVAPYVLALSIDFYVAAFDNCMWFCALRL